MTNRVELPIQLNVSLKNRELLNKTQTGINNNNNVYGLNTSAELSVVTGYSKFTNYDTLKRYYKHQI